MGEEMIVEVQDLKQYFKINDRLTIKAVDGISFGIQRGEVLGLVGETGCGKSTVARTLAGIYKPTEGKFFFEGHLVSGKNASSEHVRKLKREMQMIFQDSAASLNPRMTVEKIILEPLVIQKRMADSEAVTERLIDMMHNVGLSENFLSKRPGELSGGQRQRVSIARSLMLNPKLIIADEPIASLDISIQAQIMTLFRRLQREQKFSFLFIAHDLSVVRYISDRIGVMFRGKIVEMASVDELFNNPIHPYTQSLLSAVHVPDPIYERTKKIYYYDQNMILGTNFTERAPNHWVLE